MLPPHWATRMLWTARALNRDFALLLNGGLSVCHPVVSLITLPGVSNLWITLNLNRIWLLYILYFNCRPMCYNLQSQRGQDQSSKSSKAGPNIESVQDPDQDITTAIKTGNKQMKLVSEKSLGLDQAILHSINCCRKWSTLTEGWVLL